MVELTKENFDTEVLQAKGKVFVDFFGDGCVPCQALMPFVHQYAETYGDKIKFCGLNTTKARRLGNRAARTGTAGDGSLPER